MLVDLASKPSGKTPATAAGVVSAAAQPAVMRHVALLIDSSGAYGRGILKGIAKFNRMHGNWSVYHRPTGLSDAPPEWLSDWKGDGVIARSDSPKVLQFAKTARAAIVNVRAAAAKQNLPTVMVDNVAVARMAAEHLLERGLRHFAFCNKAGTNVALHQRQQAFVKAVQKAGFKCDAHAPSEDESWEEQQEKLSTFLRGLSKPCGILACNDERGLEVLDACRRAGMSVPEEIAVIGADNDVTLCELGIPPLTSVDVNSEAVGFQAAVLLDRMMNGKAGPAHPVCVPPRGIVARRSTELTASDDEDVCRALKYIEENACRGLQAIDVLGHLGMSRASLQMRMKQVTGRTIHREIQRVRLTKAKNLLAASDMTIKQVARESGFASVQYMTRVFRDLIDETPAQYRRTRAL